MDNNEIRGHCNLPYQPTAITWVDLIQKLEKINCQKYPEKNINLKFLLILRYVNCKVWVGDLIA